MVSIFLATGDMIMLTKTVVLCGDIADFDLLNEFTLTPEQEDYLTIRMMEGYLWLDN